MKTVAELNYLRKNAGLPLVRFDITRLNEADIQDLRDAYAALYEISELAVGDRRGYFALARGHGYDLDLCHDDNRIFLTWHRSYVYSFEKALNSALQWKRGYRNLELTLPYWDWTEYRSATHATNGIPRVINDPTYENSAGDTVENPLSRAKSFYRSVSQGLVGEEEYTQRFPDRLRGEIPFFADDVERLMDNPNYYSFQSDLDSSPHGALHVVLGGRGASSPLPGNAGDMSSVISAAFDPAFWLHHCMVDKVWFNWQERHPSANVPDHVLDTVVYDGRIGRDLIDAEHSLKYIYSNDSVEAVAAESGTTDTVRAAGLSADVPDPGPFELELGLVEAGFARAQLDFHSMRPPKENYEIRAYVGNPKCRDTTGLEDESYAGRLVLFGHGTCHGAPGHCNPALSSRDDYDIRSKHPLRYEHTRYVMDITRGLRRYLGRKKTHPDIKIYLLFLDGNGKVVHPGKVEFEGCSLRTFAKK